jgi:maltooligosyltrehalose synthase
MQSPDYEERDGQRAECAGTRCGVLRRALREVIACFPVYRTYVDEEGAPTEADRRDLD